MNIIFIPKYGGRTRPIHLSGRLIGILIVSTVSLLSTMSAAGYWLGKEGSKYGPAALVEVWQNEMAKQRYEITSARQDAGENLDALAVRLGRLQSHIIRLDALGGRLTDMAHLNNGEFDFTEQPAQGGPASGEFHGLVDVPNFIGSLNKLADQVESRAQQLGLLETMLMSRNLESQVIPAGRPINAGWLSSYFGMRTDPFSGRQEHHKGVDFAGSMGSNVVSVASGVVTWAGRRYGYGNLVEINHGNGYSTRYGHNKEVRVSVGEAVKKGQILALMGSTGRSTGPHVHFEVLRNGHAVDPMTYIKSKKATSLFK